jgi:uncharacterized protein YhaN
MSVWIKQVTVSNLGPINDLLVDLGKFNLFFGYNETGKTYLTEFILSSIFHNASEKEWSLRDLSGRGRIVISGLEDHETSFMPSSRKKIEDFWTEQDIGLPLDMARLLVVKGGELALSPSKTGGVGRDVLKSTLSQDAKLDQILDNVSKTVQSCALVNGEIEGPHRGEYKDRENYFEIKQKRNRLLEQVNQEYSIGNIRDLENLKERIQSEIKIQENAKRFRAYSIYREIQEFSQKLDQLQEKELEELRDKIIEHEKQNNEIQSLEEKIEKLNQSLRNIHWLEEGIVSWESMSLGNVPKAKLLLLILGAIFMSLGMASAISAVWIQDVSLIYALPILGIVFFLVGCIIVGFYIWNIHRRNKNNLWAEERSVLEREFINRFKQKTSGLTGLRAQLNRLRQLETVKSELQGRYQKIDGRILELEKEIQATFFKITERKVLQDEWRSTLQSLREQRKYITGILQDKRIELGVMSVDDNKFITEPAEKEYDPSIYNDLKNKLEEVEKEIKSEKDRLNSLKQKVCNETDDDQSISWTTLIENLEKLIEKTSSDYKKTTAQILAGIGMTSVLQKVREEEDQKINRDLNSPEVINTLLKVTGHLNDLELEGDSVIVRDDLGIYPLADLSTGAREQVQIALRIGIANRISGGEPLFMILDDAFQHSDWNRREKLIDTIIEMAKSGWQMIYLSMDYHIRSRMYEKGTIEFGKDFCYFEL